MKPPDDNLGLSLREGSRNVSELSDALQDPREKRIDDMLTHYIDALEGEGRRADLLGVNGGGSRNAYHELPAMWKRSGYPTLERLLHALKLGASTLHGPALYSHVDGWYFKVQRVRVPAYVWVLEPNGRPRLGGDGEPVARKNAKGEPIRRVQNGVEQFELRCRRASWVRVERVREAVSELAGMWPRGAKYEPETWTEIADRIDKQREQEKVAA